MDEFSYHILLEAQIIMIRVAGMQAANEQAKLNGERLLPYGEKDFEAEACGMQHQSTAMRNRAG